VLLRAMVLLPLTAAGVRLLGLRRVQGLLERLAPRPDQHRPAEEGAAERTARAVATAAGCFPLPASCLPRSIALWWLLRRQGINSRLRLGVRKAGGSLLAHAWVEHQGRPLNERADVAKHFAAFEDFGSAGARDR